MDGATRPASDVKAEPQSVCVECGAPCATLVHDGPDLVRLARCERCGHISDRYVEHDLLLLLIDLLLHRDAAYRHLLRNHRQRPSRAERGLSAGVLSEPWRLWLAVAACDVHSKRTMAGMIGSSMLKVEVPASLPALSLSFGWPFGSSALEFAVFTAVAATAAGGSLSLRRVAAALAYSSVGKGLLALSMIWEYPAPMAFTAAVEAFTLSCNVVALRVVHEPEKLPAQRAVVAVATAAAARTLLAAVLLLASPT